MRETSPNDGGTFQPGNHWLICDSCGLKFRRSEMRMRWDNMMVCRKDWEPRHPQEFVRGKRERIAVDIARPDSDPVMITTPVTQDDL